LFFFILLSLKIIVGNHGFTNMFFGEMSNTRVIRFLQLVIVLLTVIFGDTLFFGIFFPSDSTCTVYVTEVSITLSFVRIKVRVRVSDICRKEFIL
jgi:hypothetical protein